MGKSALSWIVVGTCAVIAASCGGGGGGSGGSGGEDTAPLHPAMVPANAWDGPAPESATEIKPAEFAEGLRDGTLRLVTPAGSAAEEEAARTEWESLRTRAEELYATTPDLLGRLTEEPDASDPDLELLPDGCWRLRVRDAPGQADRHLTLLGQRHAYAALVRARELDRSRDNQAGLYRTLFARLSPDVISRQGFPDPDDTGAYTVEALKQEVHKIGFLWPSLLPASGGQPVDYPTSAAEEEGHGGIDGAAYAPHTGMWPQVDFPLKWCVTSVKDQGTRSTSAAFAITAAVEAIVARDHGRWTNLSEQMLYWKAKIEWWPADWTEGLILGSLLERMSAFDVLDPLFVYPWESSWDYNRSPARIQSHPYFAKSCWGTDTIPAYSGEYCSEGVHQSPMVNVPDGEGGTWWAFAQHVPVVGDAQFRVSTCHCLGDPETLSLDVVRATLALGIPVLVTVKVSDDMGPDHMGGTGIVPYPSVGTNGWQSVPLFGYVPNADVPPATPLAAGGGYFVVKNSWGADYGDGGYCYLPADWLTERCVSVDSLDVGTWFPP